MYKTMNKIESAMQWQRSIVERSGSEENRTKAKAYIIEYDKALRVEKLLVLRKLQKELKFLLQEWNIALNQGQLAKAEHIEIDVMGVRQECKDMEQSLWSRD